MSLNTTKTIKPILIASTNWHYFLILINTQSRHNPYTPLLLLEKLCRGKIIRACHKMTQLRSCWNLKTVRVHPLSVAYSTEWTLGKSSTDHAAA